MKFLLVLSTLIISVYCQQYPIIVTDTNCGKGTALPKIDEPQGRIVGGDVITKGHFGWHVLLHDNGKLICSGALINSNWIITSAYCVYGRNQNTLGADFGVQDRTNWDSWSTYRKVSRVVIHPNYVHNQFKNDIAMIRLATPVNIDTFSYRIVPICVASGLENYEGRYGYVTGYGSPYSGGDSTRYLYRARLPVLNDARCRQKYSSQYSIDSYTQLCGGESFGNVDFCEYDNGSPLVVQGANDGRWHLVGLASFGYNPCGNGGVYTRVSAFTSFISSYLNN